MKQWKAKKWFKRVLGAVLTLGLLVPQTAMASVTMDEAHSMGISVGYEVDTDQDARIEIHDKNGEGVTYSLYQVGVYSEDGTAYYTDDFYAYISELTITPQTAADSGKSEELAEGLVSIINNHSIQPYKQTAPLDSTKVAVFEDLTPGYYLAIAGSYTNSEGYVYSASPVLVSVPGSGENGEYSVTAQAKSEFVKPTKPNTPSTPTPTPTTPKNTDKVLPYTGVMWWPVIALAAGGMILYIAGLIIDARGRRRKRRTNE